MLRTQVNRGISVSRETGTVDARVPHVWDTSEITPPSTEYLLRATLSTVSYRLDSCGSGHCDGSVRVRAAGSIP